MDHDTENTRDDAALPDAAAAPGEPGTDPSTLVGSTCSGTVVRVVEFGAFVELDGTGGPPVTGMVHVSEVSHEFVDNIYAHVGEGDQVEVVVLEVRDDGRVSLSIKAALPEQDAPAPIAKQDPADVERMLRKFRHTSQRVQAQRRRQRRDRLGS